MGGTTVETPGPSAAQTNLQQQQAATLASQREIIEKQAKQQELLLPILLEQSGISIIKDDEGNVVDFKVEDDPNKVLREGIETSLLERSKAALAGELPDNPALLRDLAEQEGTLRESLRKRLGTEFETSTPGIEALGDFFERSEILLDASRRGDLTTSEALSLGREAAGNQTLQTFLSGVTGVANQPLATASALGGLAAGQGGAAQVFQQDSAIRLAARTETARNISARSQALIGGAFGTGSSLGAAAIFA